MVKIIKVFFILTILNSCGKKGDLIRDNIDSNEKPANINKERIYQL